MCPPRTFRNKVAIFAEPPPEEWLATTTCCKVKSYVHVENRRYLCRPCFNQKDFVEQRHHNYVIRHYLRLGTQIDFEACFECNRCVVFEYSTHDCPECPSVQSRFIDQLLATGDRPYDSPEAVCIAISQHTIITGMNLYRV